MISTHLLRKMSIDAVLNPPVEIRGEKARSILSYAVAGIVTHKTIRQQIMMENAADARKQALQEYHRQFNNVFLRKMAPFLREKYDMTLYKKALLATGNREIHYLREGQRNHDIEQFLTIIRSTIREQENKKHTKSGKVEYQYQLTNLVNRVYQTLQTLIRSGVENLNRFTGKSLHEIADILGIFSIPLTAAQKSALHQLDNPQIQYPQYGNDVQSQSLLNTVSVLPKGADVATVTMNDLSLEHNSQYTFVLDQNVTYKMEGNDITMPPGTKLTAVIYAFQANNGNPYLVVIPNRAFGPTGTQFQFPMTNQEFRLFVTPGLRIVHQQSWENSMMDQSMEQDPEPNMNWRKPIRKIKLRDSARPADSGALDIAAILPQRQGTATQNVKKQVSVRPNMNLFNIVTGASYNDDRDIKFIAGMENADVGASIIPFWLQIRHAHDYNQKQYSEKIIQGQICNAFATCVLHEKGFPYETSEQKEEFRRQKNEFCDTLTSSRQEQIQQLWAKRSAPFSRLTKEELQDIEKTLYKPLSVAVDSKAEPQQIADWFRRNNALPDNIITLKDIHNNEEGVIVIEDTDVNNIHSCKYLFGVGRSVEFLTVKSMVVEIWNKMKKIKIRELLRDGMSEIDARSAVSKFFQSTYKFIDKMEDAQKLYEEYSNIVIQKRVRSALTNVYDTDNKQYKTLQRLLVTITDPAQLAGKDAFFQLFTPDFIRHRNNLITLYVQPFSADELIKMTPVRIPFTPSAADLSWLQTQFADVLMALNCFLKYTQKKGDSSRVVELRHTKFVVNMYAKCFDQISDEMNMSVDDDMPDIPKDFRELVFFEMGNDSLRYVWAYMISLYNARVLLRQKLAAKGLKMESHTTIDRISSKLADEFAEKLDGSFFGKSAILPDKSFFHLAALAFSSIIFNLHQYWKSNRSRVSRAQTFGQPEIDFAYHILSRQEAGNVESKGENNAVKNLVERLSESWPNADEIPTAISSRLYDLMLDLYNNQTRFMASIKSRLYYFATINNAEKEVVKDDMNEEEDRKDDSDDIESEHEKDDDHPEEGEDYEDYEEDEDELFGADDEDDLFGDNE